MDAFNRDSHLYKVLLQVKKRPGMFIAPISVESLRNFLVGYGCSNLFNEKKIDTIQSCHLNFYDWLAMKETSKLQPSRGWVDVMKQNYSDDEESFLRFFDHLESYMDREPSLRAEYLTTAEDVENCEYEINGEFFVPAKIQIVSYDLSVKSVFIRYFDGNETQLMSEIHIDSVEDACGYLKSTFNLSVSP